MKKTISAGVKDKKSPFFSVFDLKYEKKDAFYPVITGGKFPTSRLNHEKVIDNVSSLQPGFAA